MIVHNYGNITWVEAGLILHGVSLQGVMGAGVAFDIAQRWPIVHTNYIAWTMEIHNSGKSLESYLGEVQFVNISDSLTVANGLTQHFYGHGDKRYAIPDAIEKCIETACIHAIENKLLVLHIPEIGGKRGGINFEAEIMPRIEKIDKKFEGLFIQIWHYDEPKRY